MSMDDSKIKALILDMDGVIWRKKEPIGDLEEIFRQITAKGIRFAFATNNSSTTTEDYAAFLNSLGIQVKPQQIFTSGKATADLLVEEFPSGGNIFVVGMPGLAKTISQKGFNISAEKPVAVVAGIDFEVTYDKLKTAALLIRSGVPFYGSNPDKTFPTPEGQAPGAGAILASLEAATDVKPRIVGKPQPTMFRQALAFLAEPADSVLVVGDRLETDIAGGQAAGCKTALVLSGVSSREQAEHWRPTPDYITADLTELVESLPQV
jgi:4-nitrophenyl phosphatase